MSRKKSPGLLFRAQGEDVLIRVKAVPGASRDGVAGVLGDRLKVRVSAPPEGGRANRAVCAVIARALGVKQRQVSIETGRTSPEKTIRVEDCRVGSVAERLG